MGAGFEQRPWTPTVRRGPIAAEVQTPAPNAVELPSLLGLFEFFHFFLIFSNFRFKFTARKKNEFHIFQYAFLNGVEVALRRSCRQRPNLVRKKIIRKTKSTISLCRLRQP